ncbi:MAG: phosphoglycerate kinase [Ectothiorhodospiraceae bacterium]|nr:phosphoglycerate kinase [Ectothiorhodospiraceae bacterium]
MNKLTIQDVDLKDRRVLVRVDFNVPLDDSGNVTDDTRIAASLPTIQELLKKHAGVILMSHLGRPKGKAKPELSLHPVAKRLSELLGQPVKFAGDCIGADVEQLARNLQNGEVLLLENLRFHAEEEANDADFAKKLASLGEAYVNDAFGSAHRAHASTAGVTEHLSPCVAGFLMEKELDYLNRATANPEHPYTAILGGAKISGKIDVIQNLMDKVDNLLIGGGMTYTFLKAKGYEIGTSLLEEDKIDLAKSLLDEAGRKGKNLMLPVDNIAAKEFSNEAERSTVASDAIPGDVMGMDIGPKTVKAYEDVVKKSKTVVWNGPMGVFEMPNFAAGTKAIARALADATKTGAVTIIGGGDSAAAIAKAGLEDAVSHVSTGGGASLEFLEGKTLPGVAALDDK